MKEETIATFKHNNNKYKLLQMTIIKINPRKKQTTEETVYLVVKNRKRIYRTTYPYLAGKKLAQIIVEDLLQLKFTF